MPEFEDRPDNLPLTEAEAIASLAVLGAKGEECHGHPVVTLPRGARIDVLTRLLPTPPRMAASDVVHTPASFVTHWGRYKANGVGPIWADRDKLGIVAIYNDATDAPAWRDWRLTLQLRHSPQWKAWLAVHREPLPQAVFVDFLEDRLDEISDPPSADLLELCRDLQGHVGARWSQSVDPRTGAKTLAWAEDATTGTPRRGETPVPATITLALPVFDGSRLIAIKARLRTRVAQDGIKFVVVLPEPDLIVDEEFARVADQVADACGAVWLHGRPGDVKA